MASKSKIQNKADSKDKQKQKEDPREKYAFKVLSAKQTTQLLEVIDEDDLQQQMAEVMGINRMETELRDACVLDYYVGAFWWGRDEGFTTEQISAFFTIAHQIFNNLKERKMSLLDNMKEFRKILANCVTDAPVEENSKYETFNFHQGLAITDYISRSIFQHYQLYEFVFHSPQTMQITGSSLKLETPLPASLPWPHPLVEAISEEFYNDFVVEKLPETGEGGEGEGEKAAKEEQMTAEELQREADILSRLTAQQIQQVMDEVFTDVLGNLQVEVTEKLREQENSFINRINKLHKTT